MPGRREPDPENTSMAMELGLLTVQIGRQLFQKTQTFLIKGLVMIQEVRS